MQYSHYDNEYYLLLRENNKNYPLLKIDEEKYSQWRDSGIFNSPFELYNDGYVYPLDVMDPVSDTPEFVDYHRRPNVFSLKVIEQVTQMGIAGTQWFPACINHHGVRYNDYIVMHTYKRIECLDKNYSEFDMWDEDTFDIEKIVLDKSVLDSIDLKDRLIFKLKESSLLHFFHESIVDEIMKHDPKGCRFIKSKDWGVGSAFD
jgi:hypothetical protein